MSKIALTPNATGTGVFTISSPATNTDRTLTLPDEAGTVLTSGTPVLAQKGVPAFSARMSANQTISSTVWTKVQMDTEEFDTDSCYDTTNYRFTPTVAGYYLFSFNVWGGASTSPARIIGNIYKNGSTAKRVHDGDGGAYGSTGSALIYMNGSTDYVEPFIYIDATIALVEASTSLNYFQGILVRAA